MIATIIDILAASAIPMVWLVHHWRREARKARFDLQVSIQAAEFLCRELDSYKAMTIMLERTSYALACEIHGQAAVDRSIQNAANRNASRN